MLSDLSRVKQGDQHRAPVERLHDQLSQHLAGTVLAAGALSTRLLRRGAPEAVEATCLVDMILTANRQLSRLVTSLNKEGSS